MPAAPRFTERHVRAAVARALGPARSVAHLPVGWGNENWKVETTSGRYVVKIGPPGSAAKWAATHCVYDLGTGAGLPLPRLVHHDPVCEAVDGWVLRAFTWIDGQHPSRVLTSPAAVRRFFGALGCFVRQLHALPAPSFTSRLDGSAPAFERWSAYLTWRLDAVVERLRSTAGIDDDDLALLAEQVQRLAAAVDDVARPAICHRDLYLDNLLATAEGGLAAVLDFDGAEAWDPAVDVVKPRWLVFPHHRGADAAFADAYGTEPSWEARVRAAELIEVANAVPNSITHANRAYEHRARTRLRELLHG